jgi:hypothetical protein
MQVSWLRPSLAIPVHGASGPAAGNALRTADAVPCSSDPFVQRHSRLIIGWLPGGLQVGFAHHFKPKRFSDADVRPLRAGS